MELVIKLNDETYKEVMDRTEFDTLVLGIKLIEAVQNGTPLPKGHGRLIDADSIYQIVKPIEPSDAEWGMTAETAIRLIHDAFNKASTIVEADKENKDDKQKKNISSM